MNNRNIQILTAEAKGVTTNLMCMMMEGEPYGTLFIDGTRYDASILSKMLSIAEPQLLSILDEIVNTGKDIKLNEHGLLYSEHMLRDAEISQIRKEIGSKGGNPVLTGKLPAKINSVSSDSPPDRSNISRPDTPSAT